MANLRMSVWFGLLLWLSGQAVAEQIGPNPAFAPEEVIAIQLAALQDNDSPARNAGIRQTFLLAHPDNKRVTGPLARFELMIRSPAYRPLLGHTAHQIERVDGNETRVRFLVVIETPNGKAFQYLWEVGRVSGGPHTGAWLTTNVSVPRKAGQVL